MARAEFFNRVRELKHGHGDDDSQALAHMPEGANRRKHERMAAEVIIAQGIMRLLPLDLGYDPTITPELNEQLGNLLRKVEDTVKELFRQPEMKVLAHRMSPHLRRRDSEKMNEQLHTMSPEDAAQQAVVRIMTESFDGAILDHCSFIHTICEVLHSRFPEYSPQHIADVLKRSYRISDWLAAMHGKHEPLMKAYMGRYDGGTDRVRYRPECIRLVGSEDKMYAEADYERLLPERENMEPPITDELGCPAAYSQLVHRLWFALVDIYEEIGELETVPPMYSRS